MSMEISRQTGAFPLSENLFGGQDIFDPSCKLFDGERLGQHVHSGPQMAVSDHGVLGVPRDKEHFQLRPEHQSRISELPSIDAAG